MSELIDELLADGRARMGKAVEATQVEFSTVRTGRASPSLLDRIHVDYYGTPTPLNHLAEEGRVKIRNVRRDVMHDLRELRKEGEVGEDEERRAEAELQKITDERVAELDSHLKGKEAEILEV